MAMSPRGGVSLVAAFAASAKCTHKSCPHSGSRQHCHVQVPCPEPGASDHSSHKCGFSVRTRSAVALSDGILTGWLGQTQNARNFATSHFSDTDQLERDGSDIKAHHFTSYQICCEECPMRGKAHSHCLLCVCPEPSAGNNVGHGCGFEQVTRGTHVLETGVLVGWSRPSLWKQHEATCHGQAKLRSNVASGLEAWATAHVVRATPGDLQLQGPDRRGEVPDGHVGVSVSAGEAGRSRAVASSIPAAGEVVFLQPLKRIPGKQSPAWAGVFTGRTATVDGALLGEVRLQHDGGCVWRLAADIFRQPRSIDAQHAALRADEPLISALSQAVQAGASSGILQCLRHAHGQQCLPPRKRAVLGDCSVPLGCDVAFTQPSMAEACVRWGRMVKREFATLTCRTRACVMRVASRECSREFVRLDCYL